MRRLAAAVAIVVSTFGLLGREVSAAEAGDAERRPVPFAALDGWPGEDHAAALATFRRSCAARKAAAAIGPACRAATRPADRSAAGARAFFEAWFDPVEIVPPAGTGFLTGYFEPEYPGALEPSAAYPAPLLAPPSPSVPRPLPERAAIEAGALGRAARPIAYLDPVDAFVTHVQGSARIRLEGGRTIRVGFAGRNGQPYTSIGKVIAERDGIPPAALGLEALTAWLRSHPGEAAATMALNRSYIFFRRADGLAPGSGPVGAAGIPLTPGRSLAVDRAAWSYGLPVWLEAELPDPDGGRRALRRLVVAQDTGAAIVGPARGDLFLGSGPEAGRRAGPLRERARFVVLVPRRAGANWPGANRPGENRP